MSKTEIKQRFAVAVRQIKKLEIRRETGRVLLPNRSKENNIIVC